MKKNTDTYYFTYDASGKPATVTYNGAKYTYIKNLQGDIVGILDASGNLVIEYRYDAWGAPTSILCVNIACDDLAFDNPFRYRGYVWDEETELYYLISRNYNPETDRFINADSIVTTGQGILGSNMFTYCQNNPVRREDVSGTASVDMFDADGNTATDDDLRFDGGKISNGSDAWSAFMRSMQDGLNGLKMASGVRYPNYSENHHIISNRRKHPVYIQEILTRYNYDLNHPSNIVPLEGHRGRHSNAYHEYIYGEILSLDTYSEGNLNYFIEGMYELGKFIKKHPQLPYAKK